MMTSLWIGNLLDNHITIKTNSSLESWYQCRNWALGILNLQTNGFNSSYLGPLHTRDWEHVTITLQAFSLVEKAEPVQVRFTLHLRDQHNIWMQDGCKVYIASNKSCFMVIWTIFKNHLLEVGLTQNREIVALQTFTTINLFYFIMCEDPHE